MVGKPGQKHGHDGFKDHVDKTLLTNTDFAFRLNVSGTVVKRWIQEGKISPESLITPEGSKRSYIWYENAVTELKKTLRIQELMKMGIGDVVSDGQKKYDSMTRKRMADAEKAELQAESLRRDLAVDTGRWLEREDAERAWARELTRLLTNIDVFIGSTLPRHIGDEFDLDWKLVSIEAKNLWRDFRRSTSKELIEAGIGETEETSTG